MPLSACYFSSFLIRSVCTSRRQYTELAMEVHGAGNISSVRACSNSPLADGGWRNNSSGGWRQPAGVASSAPISAALPSPLARTNRSWYGTTATRHGQLEQNSDKGHVLPVSRQDEHGGRVRWRAGRLVAAVAGICSRRHGLVRRPDM